MAKRARETESDATTPSLADLERYVKSLEEVLEFELETQTCGFKGCKRYYVTWSCTFCDKEASMCVICDSHDRYARCWDEPEICERTFCHLHGDVDVGICERCQEDEREMEEYRKDTGGAQ
jgi:hypothetical protein